MPAKKAKRRRRRKRKVVRKAARCPNCKRKLSRTRVPGRYLCERCDVFWTKASLKAVAKFD